MAAESIILYIDPTQVAAQKNNQYSLFLAKKVNGQYTVIWQSHGCKATPNHPAYGYRNNFEIEVPSYQVNYGIVTTVDGSVSYTQGGLAANPIDLGQQVVLDDNGLFGIPTNNGTAGEITIQNQYGDNPNAILLDSNGNTIFVNVASGMDIGTATLTPIDTYQIWFDNDQETGTIIAHNVSNPATVTFSGGDTSKTISYNASGMWQNGPLSLSVELVDNELPVSMTVVATFTTALTIAASTYLMNKLINKFSDALRPSSIEASVGGMKLTVKFSGSNNHQILKAFGADKFEFAVDKALRAAKADPNSSLQKETWSLSEAAINVAY